MPILPSPLRLENLDDHPLSSVRWGVDSLQVGSGLRRGRRKEDLTQEEIFAGLIMAPHDTFIFRAPLPLPPESFQDLEFPMNRYFAGHAVVARLVDTGFEVVNPSVLTLFPFTITSLGCGSGPRLGRNYGRFPRRRGNSTLFVLVIFLWSIVDTHIHNCFLFIVFNLVTHGTLHRPLPLGWWE